MPTCFVIQPFDRGRFDKRYKDIYKPAIEAAGLKPYRVDQDPAVEIPIREIESGIRRAEICFAEITDDNPNVWFELGYAMAARKSVVMVCAEERKRFPFDVQHRNIIRYKTEAPSDFEALRDTITERLKAQLERQIEVGEIADLSPVAPTEGLSSHELVLLVTVAGSASPGGYVSVYNARQDMGQAGFTEIAVTLAMRSLLMKGFVETDMLEPFQDEPYEALRATTQGLDWLEAHQDLLVLKDKPRKQSTTPFANDDDLPF